MNIKHPRKITKYLKHSSLHRNYNHNHKFRSTNNPYFD